MAGMCSFRSLTHLMMCSSTSRKRCRRSPSRRARSTRTLSHREPVAPPWADELTWALGARGNYGDGDHPAFPVHFLFPCEHPHDLVLHRLVEQQRYLRERSAVAALPGLPHTVPCCWVRFLRNNSMPSSTVRIRLMSSQRTCPRRACMERARERRAQRSHMGLASQTPHNQPRAGARFQAHG
jgi:hypothetical protein